MSIKISSQFDAGANEVVNATSANAIDLNIRKGAGTNYSIWATAKKGTILDVLETQGDWVRVGWQQWCMSNYNGVRYLG